MVPSSSQVKDGGRRQAGSTGSALATDIAVSSCSRSSQKTSGGWVRLCRSSSLPPSNTWVCKKGKKKQTPSLPPSHLESGALVQPARQRQAIHLDA